MVDLKFETRLQLIETKLESLLTVLDLRVSNAKTTISQPATEEEQQADRRLVGLEKAAEAIGVSPGHLRNLQWAEKVPYYRVGTSVRFDIAELREYFRRRPARNHLVSR
jgi:hypothetical protein